MVMHHTQKQSLEVVKPDMTEMQLHLPFLSSASPPVIDLF